MANKFNLKDYKAINGDEAIGSRLNEENKGNIAPVETSEKQLEDGRVGEKTTTLEGLLNQNRSGSDDFTITERSLDTKKASFDTSYRNPSAYEGDVGKLEEKRLLNDPVEEEPYESASKTPSGLRWWEVDKSKNDLPLA